MFDLEWGISRFRSGGWGYIAWGIWVGYVTQRDEGGGDDVMMREARGMRCRHCGIAYFGRRDAVAS